MSMAFGSLLFHLPCWKRTQVQIFLEAGQLEPGDTRHTGSLPWINLPKRVVNVCGFQWFCLCAHFPCCNLSHQMSYTAAMTWIGYITSLLRPPIRVGQLELKPFQFTRTKPAFYTIVYYCECFTIGNILAFTLILTQSTL